MKKYFILLISILLFIPVFVYAEECDNDKISISSISVMDITGSAKELDEATSIGKDIKLNLSMAEVGDSIKYKIVVKNESNEDYLLDKNSLSVDSDYINYSISSDDDNNIVKANSDKIFYLKATYNNLVADGNFIDGKYNDSHTMMFNLSYDDNISNPNTGVKYIFIILMILFVCVFYMFIRKRKVASIMLLIIGIVLIPLSTYALCKCDINIESNVEILNNKKFTWIDCESEYEVIYLNGMTFDDFYESEYYQNTSSEFKTSFRFWYDSPSLILRYYPNSYFECSNGTFNSDCFNDLGEIYVNDDNWAFHDSEILSNIEYAYQSYYNCGG